MNKNKKRFEKHSKEYEGIREYKVNKDYLLLDFLFDTFKDQSRNSVKSLLKNHRILIDGAPVSQFDYQLYQGDVVMVSKTPIKRKERANLPIIYEDDDLIVINKPSGLLSVASDKEKGSTAYRMLNDYVQQKDKHNRVFIVHRLDEDTSGVFMVVKNAKLRDLFQDSWNDLVKKRGYYAVVDGVLKNPSGTIKSYLKKNSLDLMYSSKKEGDGKLSITHYKVIAHNNNYSLLDVNIDTGRKNQIRVHLGEMGHNVIGDDKYGNPTNPINRLGLHAYELDIIHPITKKLMKFTSKMPEEFLKVVGSSNSINKKK